MQVPSKPRARKEITRETFGRYRLVRRIAFGGMAEILLAIDGRTEREVVLKRILPQFAVQPDFVQYFIHEGRLGQRLRHPNLVQTLEAGQVGEASYIALEYLRGMTVIDLLRAAARAGIELPLGAAVRIAADAARGLHYAHTAKDGRGASLGVVHRDVTPHNLFACDDGVTKVLDFGIAKAASQLHHTRTGTIKGKFSYLAPEQIRGEGIDHRVDVFALGIVLYELLTLKPLFRGNNDADTLQRILTLAVPPPEKVRRGVPPGLGAVALRALQRDRERRLPTAAAIADSIEAVAEDACIDASPEVVAQILAELRPRAREDGLVPTDGDSGAVRRITGTWSSAPRSAAALVEPTALAPAPTPTTTATATATARTATATATATATTTAPTTANALPLPRVSPTASAPESTSATPLELSAAALIAQPPVAVGTQSGPASSLTHDEPSLAAPPPRRTRRPLLVAAGGGLALAGLLLALLPRHTPAPALRPADPSRAPPPAAAHAAPPLAAPPFMALAPPAATPAAADATLRLQVDSAATFTVDGQPRRLAPDGALHLTPGRHKIGVTSPTLGAPRTLDVTVGAGESATRAVRPGRGRLRLAITPWAEVSVDGRTVGTTPLQPVELSEGPHTVTLDNGEVGAHLKKRIVVVPNQEILLKANLFAH